MSLALQNNKTVNTTFEEGLCVKGLHGFLTYRAFLTFYCSVFKHSFISEIK